MGLPPWMIPPERLGPEMRRVYQEGVRAVKAGAKILIRGEDGAGKKVMAVWLHEASPRADRPMVVLNAAAVPVKMVDELLFGSRIPGATSPEGALERAHQSNLRLDEIDELGIEPSSKLRAALDARAVLPEGAPAPIPVDVQLFMTAITPWMENDADRLRHEYSQLVDVELTVPPLRERRDDIRVFAEHFPNYWRRVNGQPPVTYAPRTMELLKSSYLPMNVISLVVAVNQAADRCPGTEIRPEHLSRTIREGG